MSRQIGPGDVAAVCACVASHRRGRGRRGARPRRQGRRLCAARARGAGAARLHAARRQPALSLELAHGPALPRARARADVAHRSVPVRKRLWARRLPRQDRRSRRAARRVVHNGVAKSEFAPVTTETRATDLVFIGELRALKGVDVLLAAIGLAPARGRTVTATIVGDGPDRAAFEAQAAAAGLAGAVRFVGAKPARWGFALGRLLVVPSRAESLPYIVLEAAAAGASADRHAGRRHSRNFRARHARSSSSPAIRRRSPAPLTRHCTIRPAAATPRCVCSPACALHSPPT